MNLIDGAKELARIFHNDQFRKGTGEPYFNHVERVAINVSKYPDVTEVMIIAAYLHDTLEDTDLKQGDIFVRFGPKVVDIVLELTQPPLSAGNRKIRTKIYHEQLKNASREAKIIKLFDRYDNLMDLNKSGQKDKFIKLYLEESIDLLKCIGDVDSELSGKLADIIRQYG